VGTGRLTHCGSLTPSRPRTKSVVRQSHKLLHHCKGKANRHREPKARLLVGAQGRRGAGAQGHRGAGASAVRDAVRARADGRPASSVSRPTRTVSSGPSRVMSGKSVRAARPASDRSHFPYAPGGRRLGVDCGGVGCRPITCAPQGRRTGPHGRRGGCPGPRPASLGLPRGGTGSSCSPPACSGWRVRTSLRRAAVETSTSILLQLCRERGVGRPRVPVPCARPLLLGGRHGFDRPRRGAGLCGQGASRCGAPVGAGCAAVCVESCSTTSRIRVRVAGSSMKYTW
jgi:hypothetical protein